jgi:putative spermidine/putrescine transport system substrate-binding protein
VAGVAGSVLVGNRAFAQGLALPKSPVTINIVDVRGQPGADPGSNRKISRHDKPNLVSKVTFNKAPAPELPARSRPSRMRGASTSTAC